MSLTYQGIAETVRGRLNLPTSAKLRIQKVISNALQIFSERIVQDETKRHMLLTPISTTGTPTVGVLDLSTLVTASRLMIDKLHLGFIYNANYRTFSAAAVNTTANTITILDNGFTEGLRITLTTTAGLPSPLVVGTSYYIHITDGAAGAFQLLTMRGDTSTAVDFVTTGSGVQTILTPTLPMTQPLNHLTNPDLTNFPIAWMNQDSDKFWWLIGSNLYAFKGDGGAITTALQFVVPHIVTVAEFNTSSSIGSLSDELIDVVTELVANAETPAANP